jgi:hypothetical protein
LSTRIEPSEYAEGVAELAEAAVLAFMRGIVERVAVGSCIKPQILTDSLFKLCPLRPGSAANSLQSEA